MSNLWARIRKALLGHTAYQCALRSCRADVPEDSGFRVLPMQVYCSEEHAVEDQQMAPI
jgi:hypothetical protein